MSRPLTAALTAVTAVVTTALTASVATAATAPHARPARGGHLLSSRVFHAPRTQSGNWSGWVADGGGFGSISGSWRVPSVIPTGPGDRYSATWIGIGGNSLPDLIQAGTEQDWVGGKPVYYAWTEILPEPENTLTSFPVQPGDLITVSIHQTFLFTWEMDVSNARTGLTVPQTLFYPSLQMSAGWIHEAPLVGGNVAPLAATTNLVMQGAMANGQPIAAASGAHAVEMLGTNGMVIASPSDLSPSGTAFQVADGPAAPPPPAG
jgi:hypothetical protein